MKLDQIIPVVKAVLLNRYTIFAAIAVILYCNFISYVARYKKKPPKPKKKIIQEAAPAPKPEGENAEGGEEQPAEE
ncbi:MAG: hypothetical protein J6X37_04585 [Treponema sp.]|uniref:hypothetical protein n=1 Tax=Treponema sp. TaxID=166 RepID=UPI001B4F3B6A|nr:hypothetical protein [Treponema sp.]MBP5587983.1 hypothetical protein [Treponema sp.]